MDEVEQLLETLGLTVVATTAGDRPIFTITNIAGWAWEDYTYADAVDLLTDEEMFTAAEADAILSAAIDALTPAAA